MSPKALEVVLSSTDYLPMEEGTTHTADAEARKRIQATSRKLKGRYLAALMFLASALRCLQEGWE